MALSSSIDAMCTGVTIAGADLSGLGGGGEDELSTLVVGLNLLTV